MPLSALRFNHVLLNQRFARLWLAVSTSNLADGMNVAAAPLLAASLTRDPELVAGLSVAQRLPWFLFSLLTGALADRLDRRRALAIANALRAGALGVLGLVTALGWSKLWLLYAVFFLMGVAETLFDNATFAVLPSLVSKSDLERANSRLYTTTMLSNELVGPLLGSFLFAATVALPFFFGSGFYAASAALVLMLRGNYRPELASEPQRRTLWGDLRSGFSWYWRHPLLRVLSLWAGMVNLVSGAVYGVLVLFAQERLGLGEIGHGLLLAAGSLGGLIGGLSAGWLTRRVKPGTLLFVTNVILSGCYGAVALSRSAALVAGLMMVISFVFLVQNIVVVSLRQAVIPDELLGRVTSAYRMVGLTGLPLGAYFGGVAAKQFGLASPFWLGGAALLLAAFLVLPVLNNRRIQDARA